MAFQPNDDVALLSLFRQQMDEMLGQMFRFGEQGCSRYEFSPSIDIFESMERYVIETDLPGLAESDFTVTVVGQSLRIEGVKRLEKGTSSMNYICLERHFGRFLRTIDIPATFDPARVEKIFQRGVLSIRIAKKQ